MKIEGLMRQLDDIKKEIKLITWLLVIVAAAIMSLMAGPLCGFSGG